MTFLGTVFFIFILLGWAPWTYGFIIFIRFGKILVIISSNVFSVPFFPELFSLWNSTCVTLLRLSTAHWVACPFLIQCFCLLHLRWFLISVSFYIYFWGSSSIVNLTECICSFGAGMFYSDVCGFRISLLLSSCLFPSTSWACGTFLVIGVLTTLSASSFILVISDCVFVYNCFLLVHDFLFLLLICFLSDLNSRLIL